MDCKIVKNTDGKINDVLNQTGQSSSLFKQILNVPTLTLDEAIDAYKNIYSEQLKSKVQINYSKSIADNSIQQAVKRNNGNPLTLAPNGKPSILYQSYKDLGYSDSEVEKLVSQVYSDSFFQFFGDWINDPQNASKVVDSEGQPLVMYHGTPSTDITEFKRENRVKESSGLREVADFFTSNIRLAELYKKGEVSSEYKDSVKKEIYKLKESLYNVRNNRDWDRISNEIALLESKLDGAVYKTFLNVREPFKGDGKGTDQRGWNTLRLNIGYKTTVNRSDLLDALSGVNEAAVLNKKYDGAIVENIADMQTNVDIFNPDSEEAKIRAKPFLGTVVAVFNPNQIKSATENIGTFSTDSNDIRYQNSPQKNFEKGEITQEIIDKLKQNGLSEDVFLLSTEEINAKLIELGVSEDVRRQVVLPNGYTITKDNKNRLLLKIKDKEVGRLELLSPDTDSMGNTYVSIDIEINKNHRNKGLSVYLYREALKEAKKLGHSGLLSIDGSLESPEKSLKTRKYFSGRYTSDEKLVKQVNEAIKESNSITESENKVWGDNEPLLPLETQVYLIEEQIQFSKSLNNVGINLITNGLTYKDSKTGKDIVILNKDTATDETLVHEFSHIFSKWQKENRPELWKKGQNLAKDAIKRGEIQEIVSYVKQTQPKLKEGSEAFYDEVLQEFIGRESKNMMDEQKQKSPLMQWLSDFWESIKDLMGLTSMTPEQVANLNLKEFARASVVDLLKGEVIKGEDLKAFNEGVDFVQQVVEDYKSSKNIKGVSHPKVLEIYPQISQEISAIYEQSEVSSTDQNVVDAYEALENETIEQYKFITEKGLKVERWGGKGEPYANSKEMLNDLKNNKHLYFLPNDEAFGSDTKEAQGRIGLKKTDIRLTDGYQMTVSEVFRVVHDYFGHGILGNQFGAIGEENATLQHLDLYSQKALSAVIFQTRGQNSWVNFSGVNKVVLEKIKDARQKKDNNLLEEVQKMFTFAQPKDNILPNKYNFKKYETARRIKEQSEIDKSSNQYGSDEISKLLPVISRANVVEGGISRKSTTGDRQVQSYVLKNVVEVALHTSTQQAIKKAFPQISVFPKIYEITDGSVYRDLQIKGLEGVPMSKSVTIHTAEEYNQMRMFVTEDGHTGITLTKDGHLGGAFSSVKSRRKADLAQLMVIGIKEGATNAEAYDTFLPNYYSNFGFKAVSRVEFNEEIVDNWDYEGYANFNQGKPDVVHFIYDGGDRNTIEERLGQFDLYSTYQKEVTKFFDKDSYGESVFYMQNEVVKRYDFEKASETQNPVIAFQIIGEKGASRIEEYNNLLNQAKELEKQGKDYSQTGWYKGADGWKYLSKEAIKDFKIINKEDNKLLKLKEVLGDENILFTIYPEIKDLSVVFYNRNAKNSEKFKPLADNERGEFDSNDKVIRINTNHKANQGNIQGLQFTLGHEVAHKIQRVENFSRGGNATTILNEALSILNIENTGNLGEIYSKITKADKSNLTKNQLKIVKDSSKTIEALLTNNEDILEGQYLRLSGEIDANIVGELVSKGTATGTYADLLSMYLNRENIDPESIYFISGNQVQFSLRQDVSQPRQIAIEPNLSFENPKGEIFSSYSQALKATDDGAIKLKIDDVVIGEVSSSTNINTVVGSINDLVKQGILKGDRLLNPDGTISLVTEGNSFVKKLVNAYISEELFLGNPVKPSVDGRGNISIAEKQSFYEDVKALDYKQIKSKHGADIANIVLAARIYEENTKAFGQKRLIEDRQEITPENELQERLLNLLNTLGVKTVSLDKYKESYKQRNGVLPNSNSLVDIANRVIAFTNGEVTQDALTEEVAHFILEAVNQEEIAPLLANIHKTDEWAQYAEEYFNIYQDEAIVRKEILGKVLKNSIQRNFEKSQQTGTANTIIGKLAEIFNKFFTRISQFFTPQHRIDLDEYTEKIYNNLMLGELVNDLNQEQLEGNSLVLFQTSSTIQSEADLLLSKLNKALEQVEAQDRRLNSVSKEEILTLKEALKVVDIDNEEAEIARVILSISDIANRQINYLTKRDKRSLLSSEESAVFSLTVGYLSKVLTELESIIGKKTVFPNKILITKELAKTLESIRKLQGDVAISQEQNVQRIFDRVGEELDLDDATKKQLLDNFNNITRDTNVFYAYVGGAINAHNPALNIASALISKAYADRDIAFNVKSKEFMNLAKSKGYTEEQLSGLMKKWKRGHHLFSRFDFQKLEKDMLDEKVTLFREVFGKEVTADQLLKNEDTLLKAEVTDKKKIYYKKVNDFRQENQVYSPLTEEETRKSNAIYAQVSLEAQMKDKELSRQRSAITREAKRNGSFSEAEKFEMEELVRKRAKLKNPFDNQGKLKAGLGLNVEDEVIIADGFTIDTLEADSKMTYELSLIDKLKAENFKNSLQETALPKKFIDALNEMVITDESGKIVADVKKRTEFIKLNANISFSSEFWSTFDRSEGVVAKLREKEEYNIADAIQVLTTRRKHLLKASRVFNNPSETDFEDLSGETIKSLIEIEKRLEDNYNAANKILDKEDRVRNEMSESVVNQAYKNEIKDRDIKTTNEQIDFIKEHTTDTNKNKIESARLAVEAYKSGVRRDLPKALRPYITSKADAEEGLIAYAETKLASYFKKLQPVGFNYDSLLVDIASDPESFFKNMPKDVSVTPNYISLGQEENKRVNPKFAKNIEEGEPQIQLYTNTPKYEGTKRVDYKYGSKEFADYFGIDDLENPKATKNQKEYELLQALYKFQDDTIEKADMKDKHSRYLLPQKRPETLARIASIKADKKGNLKEGFKELFAYREDDAIYGQTDGKMRVGAASKTGEMTIPRHGFNRMDTADEVTDELLYSYMWMAQEAELRKSRVGILGDIESIRTILANKSYGDKHGEATTTYKMFDNFVRFNMYGQSEAFSFETNFGILSKKVNLAPLVKKFQWWIRLVNLGFSVLTPLTSFLQGSINFQVEKFVGERIDKDASRLARKQLVKLLPESMSDVMKLTSSSKLNIMSEFLGQDSSLERFKNSNYNRLTRGMAQSAYMTHAAADVPLSAQVMLTVLHDFRVVDGKLTAFAKFAEENKSKTRKEARTAWARYEDKALFNYIEIKNGVAQVTDALRTEIPDIDKRMQNVRNAITVAKQEVDSQIPSTDRTQMQRHALLSFLTLHKGWLITSMTRRFKSKHLNLYTGLEEEGSYSGTFGSDSFFSDLVQSWKKDGISLKAIKENWKNSSVTRRRSMQRVAADVAVTNALVLVALLLKNAADDDDDKDYVTQFAAYMSYRLAVEVTSQSTAFSNQVYKFLESPTTGLTQIQNVLDITSVFSGDEVTRGTYRGLSEREAWLFKSLPALKEYWKVTNIDRTRNSFEHFNHATIEFPFTLTALMVREDKEEE